jgi:hypothetical protein
MNKHVPLGNRTSVNLSNLFKKTRSLNSNHYKKEFSYHDTNLGADHEKGTSHHTREDHTAWDPHKMNQHTQ